MQSPRGAIGDAHSCPDAVGAAQYSSKGEACSSCKGAVYSSSRGTTNDYYKEPSYILHVTSVKFCVQMTQIT